MRKVRGLRTLGREVNFPPASCFFHRGNVILELNSLGRESVRHGSSFQTPAVFHGLRWKRWGWAWASFIYLAGG